MQQFLSAPLASGDTPSLFSHEITFDIQSSLQPKEYDLTMQGFLPPGWTGRLTAGLARNRIGIVRGEAEKVNSASWVSSFRLKSAPFASNVLSLDYAALAKAELPSERACEPIALRDFTMESPGRHGGSLYLELRGVDRLGFLGDLLDYFSMRCLFPVKMSIETVGDTAVDRFWLRGVGGSTPSEGIALTIEENLGKFLQA